MKFGDFQFFLKNIGGSEILLALKKKVVMLSDKQNIHRELKTFCSHCVAVCGKCVQRKLDIAGNLMST